MANSDQRNILITGVTRGLGRALAERFIEAGHTVVGCGRSSAPIAELTGRHPPPHRFDVVDVSDDRQTAEWAQSVLENTGPPDLLINNAALINPNAALWETSAGDFSALIDVNIKGVANVIRHFVPAMIDRGAGIVVNLSSGWGRSVSAEVAPYCASKWAIEGLTKAMALELPSGMAAVPVNPGIIDTEMLRSCFGSSASAYPNADRWSRKAAPFLLSLSTSDNGDSVTVPS